MTTEYKAQYVYNGDVDKNSLYCVTFLNERYKLYICEISKYLLVHCLIFYIITRSFHKLHVRR